MGGILGYFEHRAGESMHRYLLEDMRQNAEESATVAAGAVAIR
jgi:hypothetical protein